MSALIPAVRYKVIRDPIERRWARAGHEAGHALAAHHQFFRVRRVTLDETLYEWPQGGDRANVAARRILVTWAGAAGELLVMGSINPRGLGGDERQAAAIAAPHRIIQSRDEYVPRAVAFLAPLRPYLAAVTDALLEHGELSGDEFRRVETVDPYRPFPTRDAWDAARREAWAGVGIGQP